MELSLDMQVLKTPQKLPHDDSDVFFAEYSWFHLSILINESAVSERAGLTRSEHEPPEQYLQYVRSGWSMIVGTSTHSMTIHKCEPLRNDP